MKQPDLKTLTEKCIVHIVCYKETCERDPWKKGIRIGEGGPIIDLETLTFVQPYISHPVFSDGCFTVQRTVKKKD